LSNPAWDDFPTLGKRLNRLIKYSETMLKKTDKLDHDAKVRYITTITSLSRQIVDIAKTNERFEKVMGWFEEWERIKNKEYKKNAAEMVETVESQRDEIQEEKIARQTAKKRGDNYR